MQTHRLNLPSRLTSAQQALLRRHLPAGSKVSRRRAISSEQHAFLAALTIGRESPEHDCFANARTMVLQDSSGRLNYIEGYLILPDAEAQYAVALHHAWPTLDEGPVIELSVQLESSEQEWDSVSLLPGRPVGRFPDRWCYVGASVQRSRLLREKGPRFRLPTTIAAPEYVSSFLASARRERPYWSRQEVIDCICRDLEIDARTFRALYRTTISRR